MLVQVYSRAELSLLTEWCICSLIYFSMDSWVLMDYSSCCGPLLSLFILTLNCPGVRHWESLLSFPHTLLISLIAPYLMNKGSFCTSPASESGSLNQALDLFLSFLFYLFFHVISPHPFSQSHPISHTPNKI